MSSQQEDEILISPLLNYDNKLKWIRIDAGTEGYPAYTSLGYRFGEDPDWYQFLELLEILMRVKIYTTRIKNRYPSWTWCKYVEVDGRTDSNLLLHNV